MKTFESKLLNRLEQRVLDDSSRLAQAGFRRYLENMHGSKVLVCLEDGVTNNFVQVSMGQIAQALSMMMENPLVGRLEMKGDGGVVVPANSHNAVLAATPKAA